MIAAFATRDALMAVAAERIADSLQNALKTRGEACAVLSGGTTPAPAYRLLAARDDLDWSAVTFALVDERFVPPTDDASNEKLVRDTLAPAFARRAQFKPMFSAAPTAREAATRANALYTNLHIDIALMGMGEDGHTASWFPGSDGLSEALDLTTDASVVAIRAPQAVSAVERLTLTRRAVLGADRVLLLITGGAKRAQLESALADHALPVAALFSEPTRTPEVLWAP